MKHLHLWSLLASTATLAAGLSAAAAQPVVAPGFSLRVFATPPSTSVSAPDSLAIVGTSLWISYGNGVPADGSSGSSNVIEYSLDGKVQTTLTIAGHCDGLRLNPYSGLLWSLQNEDANPNLVVINPATGKQSQPIALPPVNGGGYDDVAFVGGRAYISASNPTLNSGGVNTNPAIVEFALTSGKVSVTSVLMGNARAVNGVLGTPTQLNVTDPDSMIRTPDGDLLLDGQADGVLVRLRLSPGKGPAVIEYPLLSSVQLDDSAYATSRQGTLFIADRNANTVYALDSQRFNRNGLYSASTGVGTTVPAFVGALDLDVGAVVPVVSGLVSPHGMAFLPKTP